MRIDTVCNFTNAYKSFRLFPLEEAAVFDYTSLRGTSGYCSGEAAEEIRKSVKMKDPVGVHYIDDGNHHYMTLFWLEKIREPFDLVVLDHHTDLQPPALLPVLSCGGWILSALQELELLQKVYLIGPPAEVYEKEDISFRDRIIFVNENQANNGALIAPEERPFYLSIDLDVLSREEFQSIWDQGSMCIKRLLQWIDHLQESGKIIGTDICG